MAPGNNKKRITPEVLDRLITDSEYRIACAAFELSSGGKDFPGVTPESAAVKLHGIAVEVRNILARHGATGLDGAMGDHGKVLDAWVSVRDYLNGITIPDKPDDTYRGYSGRSNWSNWSIPPVAHPAGGIVAARMVRCAIMQVHAPVRAEEVRRAEESRRRVAQDAAERQRRAEAERTEQRRKAEEKRKQKEAAHRGTCGITFAGSSARFIEDETHVFLYRQDVRRVQAIDTTLIITDSNGQEFRPDLTGAALVAFAEFTDWRWRASAEWEGRGKRNDTDSDDG